MGATPDGAEENIVEIILQVRAVFFRMFLSFGLLRNKNFTVCETQVHFLQSVAKVYTASAIPRE